MIPLHPVVGRALWRAWGHTMVLALILVPSWRAMAAAEAISREMSLFLPVPDVSPPEAISREVSFFVPEAEAAAGREAISREISLQLPDPIPVPAGLVAWWRGEGDFRDERGLSHGEARNGASLQSGLVGGALRFDGLDDGVALPGTQRGPLDLTGNSLSIVTWAYLVTTDDPPGGAQAILDKCCDGAGHGYSFGIWAGNLGLALVTTENPSASVLAVGMLPAQRWVHLAATYDGAFARVFLDGVEVGASAVSGNLLHSELEASIGNDSGGSPANGFNGLLDELAVFDRALTSDEILAIFQAGTSGFDPRLPADLVVTDIVAPSAALAGQHATVRWTVANQGTYPAKGPRRDRLVLRQAGAPDRTLGDFAIPDPLAAGTRVEFSQIIIVPPDLVGSWRFAVTTDAELEVFEGNNEANNTLEDDALVEISVPDLAVTVGWIPAATLVAGASLDVEWVVTNTAAADAGGAWRDGIYLASSPEADLASARLLYVGNSPGPLAPGGTYTTRATVIPPLAADVAPGDYHLVVVANIDRTQLEGTFANNRASQAVTLVHPPLPDLVVAEIVAPAVWASAATIPVSLVISNAGTAAVSVGWYAGVTLQPGVGPDADPGSPYFELAIPGGLPPTGVLATNLSVPLPVGLTAGAWRVLTWLDGRDQVVESDESNNSAAVLAVVPLALAWRIPSPQVREDSAPIEAQLVRNGDVTQALDVEITSTDAAELRVPSQVRFAAGGRQVSLTMTPLLDGIVDGLGTVEVIARAAGYPEAITGVTVLDVDVPALSLIPSAISVEEGQSVTVTVRRTGPVSDPVVVSFASVTPSQFIFPVPVTLPTGMAEATVGVVAADDSLVEASQGYTFVASAPGHGSTEGSIIIEDNDLPVLDLEVLPATFAEGAGGQAAYLTVRRAQASPRALTVRLENNAPTALRIPASVVIPAFNTVASVPVAAVDDAEIDGPQSAMVTAVALLTGTDQAIGNPVSRALTVTDDDGPTLTLALTHPVVREGATVVATVRRNTGTSGALVVALASSDTAEATVPLFVTIPDARASVDFVVSSLVDAGPDGSKSVTLMATAEGFTAGQTVLNVTDSDLPDIVPSTVSGPATSFVGDQPVLTFGVANQGVTSFSQRITQRIFLSRDASLGDDLLIGSYDLQPGPNGIPPGGAPIVQTIRSSYALAETGDYWVMVVADANEGVEELDESNNARVSATPIRVEPDFTATVRVDLADKVQPAGTEIPLVGSITGSVGRPLAGKRVDLHLTLREFHRVISAITDLHGGFRTVFRPLPGEAGHYTVGAARGGEASASVQDEFTLLGAAFEPAQVAVSMAETTAETRRVTLRNASEIALTGLRWEVLGDGDGLTVTLAPGASTLPGLGTVEGVYSMTAGSIMVGVGESVPQLRRHVVTLRVTSDQGTVHDLPLDVTVEPLRPRLRTEPAELVAGMLRGGQKIVEFTVINDGHAETGPLALALPEAPWFRMITPNPLPSIAPGASNSVSLLLAPDELLPFGPYTGRLALNGTAGSHVLPFTFRCLSELKGDLLVMAVDEFTYYAEGNPPVTNAAVKVTDAVTGTIVANGVTDRLGGFFVSGLLDGYYEVEVTAVDHGKYRGTTSLVPGATHELLTFIPRELVTYTWTVEPGTVDDATRLSVEVRFEANVPAPVVTVTPVPIRLADWDGSPRLVELVATNHGLISVQNARLLIPQVPGYRITAPVLEFGTLPGKGSIRFPLLFERVLNAASRGADSRRTMNGDTTEPCSIGLDFVTEYTCGTETVQLDTPIPIFTLVPGCEDLDPIVEFGSTSCDACDGFRREGSVHYTSPGTSVGGGTTCIECYKYAFSNCGSAAASAFGAAGIPSECLFPFLDCYCKYGGGPAKKDPLVQRVLDAHCRNQEPASLSSAHSDRSVASGATATVPGDDFPLWMTLSGPDLFLAATLIGMDSDRREASSEIDVLVVLLEPLLALTEAGSDGGIRITSSEADALAGHPASSLVSGTLLAGIVDRWNRSSEYWNLGHHTRIGLPQGLNPDFIERPGWLELLELRAMAYQRSSLHGYGTPAEGALIAAEAVRRTSGTQSGVCAQVKLRLEQDAVLTRSAFKASLEVENRDGDALRDVRVDLRFRTPGAVDATEWFGVREPVLDGITGVDGSGAIAAQSTGSATWILIPTLDAAPSGPTDYLVGGTLSYVQGGTRITVPLADVPITVHPGPELVVDYFHQRDVFSDDPFTDELEPAIPYALGVMVRNVGRGEARNFRITSGQPRIVENEKGLLIDFKLIGTEVDGQNLSPSLTANFGNIGAGTNGIGRWLFTSTLQGLFIDYKATFEHLDAIAGRRLSIITNVAIHEMTRIVSAQGAGADGRADFLLNEEPDLEDLADTVWLSDGTRHSVAVVGAAQVSGVVPETGGEVGVTFSAPAGFQYLRIPDPAGAVGVLPVRLVAVRGAGGVDLPAENFWQTDRTFIGLGRRPLRENWVHVFDRDAVGQYTLVYEAVAPRDTTPPSSQVVALAASVPPSFPVRWVGVDNQGGSLRLDIWVSEEGGAFAPWLREVEPGSRLFEGRAGRTYAFYSVASDVSGNREAAPTVPDAVTVASRVNRAPVIGTIADRTLTEGETLVVPVAVTDPDGDAWTLRVVEGPVGLELDAGNVLRWPTGSRTGAGTRRITVEARDGGVPAGTATASFVVEVRDFNAAPVAAQDLVERPAGKRVRVAESVLLANDADPDGGALTFVGVSGASVNGGQVRRSEGWITYIPPTGDEAPDQFTYTISDGVHQATGVVLVQVPGAEDEPTLNIVAARALEGGGIRLTIAGIPGRRYEIQVATSLEDPSWALAGVAVADSVGRFEYEDPAPPPVMAIYRAVEKVAGTETAAEQNPEFKLR